MILPKDYQSDEFLHFLASILDQGTGQLRVDRLAEALRLTKGQEAALAQALGKAGSSQPALLFDLLEVTYDRLGSIEETLDWFMRKPQSAYNGKTPFEVCLKGGLEPLRKA